MKRKTFLVICWAGEKRIREEVVKSKHPRTAITNVLTNCYPDDRIDRVEAEELPF